MKKENLKYLRERLGALELENVEALLIEIQNQVESHGEKIRIINAGLMNAGKSSLFNALIGYKKLDTGVVRVTAENTEIELDDYILVDTPGLDANCEDDETAFNGYKKANRILFIHNIVDGEFNKMEVEAIDKIAKYFATEEDFFKATTLVLTNKDQVEEAQLEELVGIMNRQLEKLFHAKFYDVVAVNSLGYLKGIEENKSLLVQHSNIETLKTSIKKSIQDQSIKASYDAYESELIEKLEAEFIASQSHILTELKKCNEELSEYKKSQNTIDKIESKLSQGHNLLKRSGSIDVKIESLYISANRRSGATYKSEYSARSDGTRACEEALRNAGSAMTSQMNAIVQRCENIAFEGSDIRNLKVALLEQCNEIKELYLSVNGTLKDFPTLNLDKVKQNSDYQKKFGDIYRDISFIDYHIFGSASNYLSGYNLDIDYDYRTEYTSGFFGMKEKDVCYYSWDISGAIDDIRDRAYDIMEDRTRPARKLAQEVQDEMLKSMEEQVTLWEKAVTTILKTMKNELCKDSQRSEQYEMKLKVNADMITECLEYVRGHKYE
ncbi:MAG: 50S ribosome-binding GTPase [bacterium]|nr:50S ribosome-binding GTPase [bacterium]